MKHKVVIKTSNTHRIVITDDVSPYKDLPNAYIDPDLKEVEGKAAPHFWIYEDGKFRLMTPPEREAITAHHNEHGVDNNHVAQVLTFSPKKKKVAINPMYLVCGGVGLSVGMLIFKLIHLLN